MDSVTVSITYRTMDAIRVGTVVLTGSGVDLEDAADLLADGAEAAGHEVTRVQVVETLTRPGRERRPRPALAATVAVDGAGEPARTVKRRIVRSGA